MKEEATYNTLSHPSLREGLGGLKKPILAVVVFLVFQLLGSLVIGIETIITGGKPALSSTVLGILLIVTGLLTVLFLQKVMKMFTWGELFDFSHAFPSKSFTALSIIGAITGILATNLLSEQIALPDLIEDQVMGLALNPLGIMSMAIIGPIVEEVVFRKACLGGMLKNGVKPWRAMWISAILFGLVHGNPAQIPFAIIIGMIFAIIYYKTGNIILTSIIHIFNNSIAVVQVWALGDAAKDFSFTEWLGGQTIAWIVIVVFAAISIYSMRYIFRIAETKN